MSKALNDRIALVTGASRGIGKAIALELARDGAHVVVCARTESATDDLPGSIGETVAAITAEGGAAEGHKLDVTDDANVDAVIDRVWSAHGRLDILVNNAGILGGGGAFIGGDPELLDRFYRTNLRAPYVIAQRVAARMADQGGGAIFNISSGLARLPDPTRGGGGARAPGSVYGASKAALDRWAVGVAAELREKNIAIVNIYPGFTLTETMQGRLPPGMDTSRMERPETCAKGLAYMCRNPMHYTGQIVVTRELVDRQGL
jgi:NAD(P)-dependent dehydrogenase (short-subunit alcohol dehydrogenase family)